MHPLIRGSRRRTRIRAARMTLAACLGTLALAAPAVAADPTVTTSPIDPAFVTNDYPLLSGVVNPNGIAVVYRFDYGETDQYGSSTPVTSAGNGKADVPVDISIEDLKPETTYHFRLVAYPDPAAGPYYGIAQISGGDQTFTTSSAPAIKFGSKKAAVVKNKAQVKLKAVGPVDESVKGKVKLTAKIGKKVRSLGSGRF